MSVDKFSFKLLKEDSTARLGKIYTPRGQIDTPAFMPVGTQATIKSAFIDDVVLAGTQIILSNTYHLMIRPGLDRIKRDRPPQYKGISCVTSGVLQRYGETLAQKTLTHTKRGFDEGCRL